VVDALYLDMNGIIHNCTHANQSEVKLTKEEMIVRIFDYISKLVQIIKPQKLLFMAIDGACMLHMCMCACYCVCGSGVLQRSR
jgi:5'-3' exonuclease